MKIEFISSRSLRYVFHTLFILYLALAGNKLAAQCSASFTPIYNQNGNVTFSNNSVYLPGQTSFTWNASDGWWAWNQVSPSHTFPGNGNYTVSLSIISGTNNFCLSSYSTVITITNSPCNNPISASFTGTTGINGTYSVTSTSSGTTQASTYTWLWGDNTSGSGQSAVHTYSFNGSKQVKLIVNDGVCTDTALNYININNVTCVADFTYSIGQNGVVNFSNTSYGTQPGASSYTWNFGNGYSSMLTHPTHSYNANGTYTVILALTSGTGNPICMDTTMAVISITNSPCNLNINASFTGTTGLNGTYTVNSTSTGTTNSATYLWLWGDNTSSSGPNAMHTYSANGWKTVKLAVTDGMCADTGFAVVNITNANCMLAASFSYNVGQNGQVNFQSTSTGTTQTSTYNWNFGDLTSGNGLNPSHVYQSNGTYTVTLNASVPSLSCFSTASAVITVTTVTCNVNAAFTFTYGPNGSLSVTSISTGTTMAATYSWDWGDNSSGTGPTAAHTYSTNGMYPVRLAVNDICSDSTSNNVFISNSSCSLNVSFSHTVLQNNLVNFASTSTGTVPGTSYFWTFQGLGSAQGATVQQAFPNPGNYNVILYVSNPNGTLTPVCTGTLVQNISVNCSPLANFSYTVLPAGLVNFASTSSGTLNNTTYSWSFGDGTNGSGPLTSHTYSNGGVHNVQLLISNGQSCPDTVYQSVNVNSIPCTANSNFTVVYGGQPQYWLASPAYFGNVTNAIWYWGDGSSTNALYPSHTYSAAGWYNICLSVTVSCNQTSSTCANYNIYKLAGSVDPAMAMATVNVVPSLPVGFEENEMRENALSIYPNPSNGKLNISFGSAAPGLVQLKLYSLTGEEVHNGTLMPEDGKSREFDLRHLAAGMYVLKISRGGRQSSHRIILSP